ncbi:MAG: hypothetical protein ACRKGH_09720 [Dehalogenimonas sp.]
MFSALGIILNAVGTLILVWGAYKYNPAKAFKTCDDNKGLLFSEEILAKTQNMRWWLIIGLFLFISGIILQLIGICPY